MTDQVNKGSFETLTSTDGVQIQAYVARPIGGPSAAKACVLIVQEIFGVNEHMRSVADGWAERGYLAVAPAFFDRVEPQVQLTYTPDGFARGRAIVEQLGMDAPMRDLRAAQQHFAGALKTAVVGYCWGGSVAFLAATRLGIAGVSYYGGRTPSFLHEHPQAPVLFHFGQHDASIPMAAVERIAATFPKAPLYVYDAGHGFNRHGHADYNEAAALLARERSEQFIAEHATAQR